MEGGKSSLARYKTTEKPTYALLNFEDLDITGIVNANGKHD